MVVTAMQLDCRTGGHTSAGWHLTPSYKHCITLPLEKWPVNIPNASISSSWMPPDAIYLYAIRVSSGQLQPDTFTGISISQTLNNFPVTLSSKSRIS